MPHRVTSCLLFWLCIYFLAILPFFTSVSVRAAKPPVALPFPDWRGGNQTSGALELLAISGCERPSRPGRSRETYRCFADGDSKSPVTLTIRGRGFPQGTPLRVLLKEHAPIPLRCKEGENECDLIMMECVNVRPSKIFPQQILTCALPNPLEVLHHKPKWMKRLTQDAMWMDLELRLKKAGMKSGLNVRGKEDVTIGVLSRSVQLCLAQENADFGVKENTFQEMSEDPLELLFQNKDESVDVHSQWLSLGIGGLGNQLHTLYRRVLLTRLPSLRGVVKTIKLPHVRGVILHGPPGNGKTLIARTIANLLDDRAKVTIVNSADILSKYVGDSEKNLRALFLSAADVDDNGMGERRDGTKNVLEGQLHTIIIDEIEALFRRRGESGDESSAKAVYDGLTNQLLTLMDGLEGAANILVIGLTNQLHVLDRALLRPGRFEVVIEIPLPDREGRRDMLFIHTRELRENHQLAPDVKLDVLVSRTEGFSGADIAGLVRAASSHALIRYRDSLGTALEETSHDGDSDEKSKVAEFQISNEDFDLALRDILKSKWQTTPGEMLGDESNDPYNGAGAPLVDYDGSFSRNKEATRRLLRSIRQSRLVDAAIVIIYGPPGSGKTVLARELLKLSEFDSKTYITGGVLHNRPHGSPLDEILTALRSALHSNGDIGIVIENVENYFRNNGPMDGVTLKVALQEFRTATHSHVPSRMHGAEKGTSSSFKRLLILTTSEKEVMYELVDGSEYDLLLSLRLIQRKDLMPLLHHYAVISPEVVTAEEVIRAYPPSLSYRQFLRITDLALWRAHEDYLSANAGEIKKEETFYSRIDARFLQARRGLGGNGNAISLNSKEHLGNFSEAVRNVVSAMGFVDNFHELVSVDDTVEGDEISW
ncbi:vesicular-fusion ATPase-like protein, putative [Trypanosoma cruzi]|nr:vesicular-fusion ATPase-like protein, putative [Trypanosoma cruzi]